MEKVIIEISEETMQKIENLKDYYNLRREFGDRNEDEYTTSDVFAKGINFFLQHMFGESQMYNSFHELIKSSDKKKGYRIKNRFAEYVKLQKKSQRQLAEECEISRSNLNNILKNRHQPSLEVFLRLWMGLNCPPISDVLYSEKQK